MSTHTPKFDEQTGKALNYSAMAKQLAMMAEEQIGWDVGDIDLFGEKTTAEDLARSLREIARVANAFADRIEQTGK